MRMVPGALACALLVISCGGDELLLPAEGDPATLAIVDGDGQIGPIGGQLADPLVVRVSDTRGRPVAGINVAFAPAAGSVQPEAATTDADGVASTQWSLGMQTGSQALDVSVPSAGPPLAVRFTATASAGAARGLIIVSGNGQSAPAGSTLPAPVVVRLFDGSGNPVNGSAVSWVIGQGGGSVAPASSTTAADGTTSATWTLGPGLGANTLSAVVSGVGTVTFTATVAAPPPPPPTTPDPSRSTLSANPTSFQAGSGSSAITVTVRDAQGAPLSGVSVQLSVSGSGNTITQPGSTNSSGVATGSFTSTGVGTKTVSATAGGVAIQQTATVTVTAAPPPPPPTPDPSRSTLSANPTSFQAGSASGSTITVTVRDAQGAPLSGVSVQLSVSGSGNTITQPGSTNSSGVATGSFTSNTAESKTVSASAGGVAIQQTATVTVTAPPPSSDASQTSAVVPNGVVGTATAMSVQVRDASGAPITTGGEAVTVSVSGTNSPGDLPVTDNGNGTYGASYTPQLAGVDQVAITLGGTPIGGSPYTSNVVAASPSQVGFLTHPANEREGRLFRPPIEGGVQDRSRNLVTRSSAEITIAISQSNDTRLQETLNRASISGVAAFDDSVGLETGGSRAFRVRD